jgi:hypothetical protein
VPSLVTLPLGLQGVDGAWQEALRRKATRELLRGLAADAWKCPLPWRYDLVACTSINHPTVALACVTAGSCPSPFAIDMSARNRPNPMYPRLNPLLAHPLQPAAAGADLVRIVGLLAVGMTATLLFTAQITVAIREAVKTPVIPIAKGKVRNPSLTLLHASCACTLQRLGWA